MASANGIVSIFPGIAEKRGSKALPCFLAPVIGFFYEACIQESVSNEFSQAISCILFLKNVAQYIISLEILQCRQAPAVTNGIFRFALNLFKIAYAVYIGTLGHLIFACKLLLPK
jgi:hypothetical protein